MPEVSTSKSNICMGCGLLIKDQFVLKCTPDLQWHESCLKCCECDCKLKENSTCFVRNGKPYCKTDYSRLFMAKCNRCGDVIKRNDLVMKSKSNMYHYNCFSCTTCNKKLLPGDEYQIKDDQLYCKEDALVTYSNTQLYLSSLAYNSMSITPESSVSSSYSPSNNSSSSSLVDSPNNSSNFSAYNFNNYNQSYSFMDHGNSEFHEKEDDGSVSDDDEIDNDEDSNDNSISEESMNESSSGSKKKSKSQKPSKPSFQSYPGNSLLKVNSGHHKPARIRTVLNEKQLHTLRACYGANPRPDALMKEQLVELTGLNPRVIRVWFQNKRCKDKKKNMLNRPDHQQMQQQNMPSIPQYTNHSIANHLQQNHHNLMYDNCY